MRPPAWSGALAPGLLLAALGCRPAAPPVPPPPPPAPPLSFPGRNLVFVSFDALQAAHVGALGYPRAVTPNLDAFVAPGFAFTRAHSVASWTVPASMTWFTGVYPSEHGMTNKFAVYNARERTPARLRDAAPGLVTLADLLRREGYATGGFTGNAGVGGGFGYDQGFDTYYSPAGTFGGFDGSVPRALAWAEAHRGQKFFLFLHGYDCHGQYGPTDRRFVAPDYDGRYAGSAPEQELLREEGLERGRLALRPADLDFWRAAYDGKIARADERFGHFVRAFAALGLADDAVFVVTSDHGTEVGEHGRLDHGFTLYDEQVRVPLFVRVPGAAGGRTVADRVGSIDVLPTVLDLLGVAPPADVRARLRGRSLVPALRGEPVGRDVFSETDYRAYTFKRSVVTPDGWKLIHTLETRTRELYDLTADPGETRDRAAADPDRAAALERKLFAHFAGIGHDLAARRWEVGLNPVYPSQAKDGAGK